MKNFIIAGNWKMNGNAQFVQLYLSRLNSNDDIKENPQLVLFPPFNYLANFQAQQKARIISYGAQNISEHQNGAYTGEISGEMLTDMGCDYVLVGHSERRTLFHESSETVAKKYQAALKVGLMPILCVGETLVQREAGEAFAIIQKQIDAVITKVGVQNINKMLIAYEPVWAIGTGKTAKPEEAQEIHGQIAEYVAQLTPEAPINVQILYGGSMKAENAEALLSMPDIHGGLIGGASLKVEDFLLIYDIARKVSYTCNR